LNGTKARARGSWLRRRLRRAKRWYRAAAALHPLSGAAEGRAPHSPAPDLQAALFDTGYYLRSNPDVRSAGVDPLRHYLEHGWREGRRPNAWFDPAHYLAKNPDVRDAGIEPLRHFILSGAAEGRAPDAMWRRHPLDASRRQIDASVPPCQRRPGRVDHSPISSAALARVLNVTVAAGTRLVVSASHDDYVANTGGVQNVIGDEERAFRRAGWGYLHVSPAVPLLMLADPTPAREFRVVLRLNGERLGVAAFADLLDSVAALRAQGTAFECVIHHHMGHTPELIIDLLRVSGAQRPVAWVHDFFTLCPSYTLMRNDVAFCGAPPPSSSACEICCYGAERMSHLARMRAFFDAARPVVLAPSEVAPNLWRQRAGLRHLDAAVLPLARLLLAPSKTVDPSDEPDRPLRVAHLGARCFHKGWSVFEELALHLADDPRYTFFQLGVPAGQPLTLNIRNIPVRVDAERRDAIVEAVAEARIDIVVSWSLWPETFCFVAYEALTGGAFVVARAGSGNVWPAVMANAANQGCVVADETELFALFAGNRLRACIEASSRRRSALLPGRGTADWLLYRPSSQPTAQCLIAASPPEEDMVIHG
jgi:hypothetical protein